MNISRTSCLRVPLIYENDLWVDNTLSDLTRTVEERVDDEIVIVKNYFYELRDGNIWLPRYYPVEQYNHRPLTHLQDGEDIQISSNVELRNELQELGFKFLTEETRGILKLPPGEGKTVISIAAIARLKKKAIIFVHKDSLVTQWIERFIQHSSLTKDDIGHLKTAKCYDLLKKPIVISTTQTMCSMIKTLPDIERLLVEANFGISIHDECHTSAGAPTFSKSALFTPARRTFGLSATPKRVDKNHDIIGYHLGEVYSPEGVSKTMDPKVIVFYFDHKAFSYHGNYILKGPPSSSKRKQDWFKDQKPRYLNMLISKKNDAYKKMVRSICKKIYEADRQLLFIADRIKILDVAAKAIPNKPEVGFFIPRSKKERDAHLQRQFVFSTPGSSRDGTDKDTFDCLVMATPIGNLEQAIGRVTRHRPNKKQPVVFDLVDTGCPTLVNVAKRRMSYYKEKGYEIEEKHIG